MRRRGRKKCRKSVLPVVADTPSANKENSFSSIFGLRKDVHNFRNSISEPSSTRGSFSSSKKKAKNRKKEEDQLNKNQPQLQAVSRTCVAFYIPLDGCYSYNDVKDLPQKKIIDWNNLLLYDYGSVTATIFSYQPEQTNMIYCYRPTVLPEMRLKYRTTSESSTNSEDSFICFESSDDVYDSPGDCKTLKCTRYSSSPKASSSFSNVVTELQPEKTPSRKKKKVRFVDNTELVKVHLIIAWDYAYRAARIGPWETMARDSNRFKLKVKSLTPILNPILSHEHRAKIWETRMRNTEIFI